LQPAGLPRVLDEAVAAYVARDVERRDHPWYAAAAPAARTRRRVLARVLDGVERALPALAPSPITERPPWALWHDPGAQAAYVAAERLADTLDHLVINARALGSVLASIRGELDRASVL
ncbi:MAG TPA: hypothetical protein VFP84_38235, partial [Kofleriaceae bacterium]|nr:hypothetical protein [Kofleriaceae bacterium]